MTCWEILVLVFGIGLMVMMMSIVILGGVSKMIDVKTESKIKLTTAIFRNEMEYLDKMFDKYMTRIEKLIEKVMEKKQ